MLFKLVGGGEGEGCLRQPRMSVKNGFIQKLCLALQQLLYERKKGKGTEISVEKEFFGGPKVGACDPPGTEWPALRSVKRAIPLAFYSRKITC
jgi:hypothetical protein